MLVPLDRQLQLRWVEITEHSQFPINPQHPHTHKLLTGSDDSAHVGSSGLSTSAEMGRNNRSFPVSYQPPTPTHTQITHRV